MAEKVSLIPDETTNREQTDINVKEVGAIADTNEKVFDISGPAATVTVEHGLDHVPIGYEIIRTSAFTDVRDQNINDNTLQIIRSNTAATIRIKIF